MTKHTIQPPYTTDIEEVLEGIERRLNQHQQWLNLVPHPLTNGMIQVRVEIHGHFASLPAEDHAALQSVADLFNAMAIAVADAISEPSRRQPEPTQPTCSPTEKPK